LEDIAINLLEPRFWTVNEASLIVQWRATIVVTAMTWSGSLAWRIPRKKAGAMMESKLIIATKVQAKPP